jgi:PPOX class probable F420-dependent enzyme
MSFPTEFHDLLYGDKKPLLYLGTSMADGSPQVTPVWFSADDEYIYVNTNEGRTKDRNMKQRPGVALVIQDPDNHYRYLGMRGEVVDYTREGADEHINQLSLKYYNRPWTYKEGQRRIIYRIRPIHLDLHG